MITEEQILEAQKSWGEGIVNIGRVRTKERHPRRRQADGGVRQPRRHPRLQRRQGPPRKTPSQTKIRLLRLIKRA